ncbi:MAG: DNA polymerase III subunit alpha [Pyrinomonadaceae bacterium]
MSFCELHTRSAFSFLSSGSQPESLAGHAADLGIGTVALLDRDTVAGAVRFHFEARERGIKPIIGAEITMDDGSLLPLVPMDLRGYQNLSRLITTIKLRHKKGEHFATRRDIEDHSAGLLCFTGGADGFIHNSVKNGTALKDAAWLNYVFERRLYVELQRHYLRNEEAINQTLLGIAHKLRLPYFASNGAYYANELDRELFDVFTCIRNHSTIYKAGKLLSENSERYLKPHTLMLQLFEDIPEAVEITGEIASRINFSMDELAYSFPDYSPPPGETVQSHLRKRAEAGARERYRHKKQEIRNQVQGRLDKELAVIEKKQLAGYFLVVGDISDYCKQEKILSQGRGSAANSVVCYAMGITAVEPIENKLLFERFLSERYEQYPDIDIDLPSGDDREKVIQQVYAQYGERGAGMTANVISYRGKSAIREVGKTFGFDPDTLGDLSKINSHYETFRGEELDRRLREDGFDPSDNIRLQKFSELYTRILDFPRHLGQHSGGMVISLGRLDGIVPLEPASMPNRNIIQWDKDDCERLKIVKVDLLGLGMMAVLRDSITLIREQHGKELDLYQIPNDDPGVYETLQRADTVGMFQVESRAQIAFLPRSKPQTFYDIVVQVAIIRPGPIVGNMLNAYIKRRQGEEEIEYIHPKLQPILERTLGVPLFQEQLLKIAMDIADFSGGEAEELRRAMGFKRPDRRMEQIEINLRAGMSRNKIGEKTQDMIVTCVKAFANYGFPESHAFSFALLAYASAYFIAHYRACFMTAMFNSYPLGFYSAATLVKDAQRHGLHFLPLDINASQYAFTVEEVNNEKQVRVGLKYVKGLRTDVGELVVAEREKNGHYTSVDDLVKRVPELNKREIRALSMAGALNFDNTIHRRQALWESELAIQKPGDLFESVGSPHVGNGSVTDLSLTAPYLQKMDGLKLVEADLKKTGISIGKHPMAFIREDLNKRGILTAMQMKAAPPREIISVAGAVVIRQRPMTAKKVVFLTMEDETGHSNFVVMPDTFEKFRTIINQNDFLIIRGIAEERGMVKALYFEPIFKFDHEVVTHDFR